MKKVYIQLCSALLLLSTTLAGAEKFQVSFLKDSSEPRLRKEVTLEATAALFAKRLSQTLKQEIKVVPFEKADAQTIFLITREAVAGGEYSKVLSGKPKDSFIIRYPVTFKGKKNVCLLMSRDAWGYCYPGNFFLRKYLGVDIVLPGELGLVIPDNSKWQMPGKINVQESPDFNTRAWTMNSYIDKELSRMYLGESRRNISWHTFGVVINPKKYGKKHPEYFPLVRGKRHNNPRKQLCDWAPCVSNPDVQKLFVEHILKNHGKGGSDAVQLSVNDGAGNHCECKNCTAWDDPAERAKGFYSSRYFTFYEKILDAALKINPEVKGIILLYSDATSMAPVRAKIHPALIGMSTREHTIREFAAKGMKQLGYWEHQLDQWYPLPRHYPQVMAKHLRELHKIGVREYFGEVYTIAAANAPKQYILGRLLWDLKSDPAKVLEEYCIKAYGPEAAPHVKRYYDTWETVYNREYKIHGGKKPGVQSYGVEKFIGLRPGDVEIMEKALEQAEKSSMTPLQKKRFMVVKNYFSYIRCLAENYLDCLTLQKKSPLSLEEINTIFKRCQARDARFAELWKNLVSKDDIGLYRYIIGKNRRKRVNPIYGLYRNAVNACVLDSVETALRNHQKSITPPMKRKERQAYWSNAYKKYPSLLPIAILIGESSGKALPNYIQNGDFKKGIPGDPKVKGAHPKLENWYFYEQIGDVLSDAYKNHWKLVKAKYSSNHLGFGDGKYPEVRQYMFLPAGVYRFSFRRLGVNAMNFMLYEVPELNKEAFSDIMKLRSYRVKSPAVFSYNHLPAPGNHHVKQSVVIERSAWYVMMIATPLRVPGSWDRLWDVRLEKLL
ncbi:MAG: DUF4838 domain-containing protein [Lentisphaeria bacterium]|nr:DUF4838 domain-containing protein [Lentisphaeria bacterium]